MFNRDQAFIRYIGGAPKRVKNYRFAARDTQCGSNSFFRRYGNICIVILLGFLIFAFPHSILAQVYNDTDVLLHEQKSAPDSGGLFADIAYAKDGTLVAVYVERDSQAGRPDKLVVKSSSNGGQSWRLLWRDRPHPGADRIQNLSIDVASGYANEGDKRVVIGAHVVDDHQRSWIAYYEGRCDKKWTKDPHVTSSTLGVEPGAWVNTSTTVIPLAGRKANEFMVAIAYSVSPGVPGDTSRIYIDYVAGRGARSGGLIKRRLIAGPGGEVVDGSANYTDPSLVHDDRNRYLSVAFSDSALQVVRVGSGSTRMGVPRLRHKWHTQSSDGRSEHSPSLAVGPDGRFILAALTGKPDFWWSYPLVVYQGTRAAISFVEFPTPLHDQAQGMPDVEVRKGLMVISVCALVEPGSSGNGGSGILALTGSPDYQDHKKGLQIQQVLLNDNPVSLSHPRVAITPDGTEPSAEAVVFCDDEWGVGRSVFIDP